jgi:mannan endo-1,6-alpha-mannosidase
MAALSVIGSTLNRDALTPKSSRTGATSKGDPNAGSQAPKDPAALRSKITTGDKAGAAILTLLATAIVIGGAIWLVT